MLRSLRLTVAPPGCAQNMAGPPRSIARPQRAGGAAGGASHRTTEVDVKASGLVLDPELCSERPPGHSHVPSRRRRHEHSSERTVRTSTNVLEHFGGDRRTGRTVRTVGMTLGRLPKEDQRYHELDNDVKKKATRS